MQLLDTLRARGITLEPRPDGKLAARPASALTDELRREIRLHKAELLAVLTTPELAAMLQAEPANIAVSDPLTLLAVDVRLVATALGLDLEPIATARQLVEDCDGIHELPRHDRLRAVLLLLRLLRDGPGCLNAPAPDLKAVGDTAVELWHAGKPDQARALWDAARDRDAERAGER